MAYIVHENQLQQMLEDLRQENPGVSDDALLSFIVNNPDIQIMKSGKIGDTQKITDYVGGKTEEELNEIFGVGADEGGNIIKEDKPKSTKEEKIDYSKQFDENQYSKIWKDNIKGFDETEPFMSNAEKVADAYRKLRDEKNRITDEYDSGQGGDKDTYMQKIKSISNAMRQAENSPEFKYLVNHIKENGITDEDRMFSPMVSTTLSDMAKHQGSLFGLSAAKNSDDRISNWLLGDVANSGIARFIEGVNPRKNNDLRYLPEISEEWNKKINEIINKNKGGNKEGISDVKNDEIKENKGTEKIAGPQKRNSIKDNKVTDDMSFGADVSGAGGNDYLEERNKSLALHLKMKGIETPEEIDAYLSKYPSWKNAKQEWKDNTLNILSDKISNMKGGIVSGKKEENADDEVKDETKDETKEGRKGKSIEIKDRKRLLDKRAPDNDSSINGIEESTAEPMYDDKGNIIGTQRSEAYLYDKSGKPIGSKKSDKYLYDKSGKPIGSKWTPSNEDSINGVEEDIAEPMIDENGKVVGTQRSEAYLYDKSGKPVASKKSDKYVYDKKGKPVGSKASNKEEKKETNKGKKLNIVKGSETIKNLLKRSKK